MAVYVDDMRAAFGGMLMCHMLADTDRELHEMARKIGVDRCWHQAPPAHDSHYDIPHTKAEIAISKGAILVTFRQLAAMNKRRKETGALGEPEAAYEWLLNYFKMVRETRMDAR